MKKIYISGAVAIAIAAIAGAAYFLWPKTEGFKQVSTTNDNVAIRGYDTVAYFVDSTAIEGDPQLKFVWNGATWLFSSAKNLEAFRNDPERFAPQFGGYCSWAVSHGYTADGDPEAWKIVDGKLYLNYNQKVREKWEAEQDMLIKAGESNWKEFRNKPPVKK